MTKMAPMHKLKLVIIIVLISGATGLFLYSRKQRQENRAVALAQAQTIGQELVTRTNSPHLLFPGNLFQQRMAQLLGAPTQVEAVRAGDEPHAPGPDRAASRIYLVNKKGARLALRIKPEGDATHFRVLGWWVPTAPPPPES